MAAFPNGHALIIGVDEYADGRWNVPIAATDAQAIEAALVDPAQGGYRPGQVDLLTGAKATREDIRAALKRLADTVQPDDTALISFTGHGAPGTDGLYYFGTFDMSFDGRQITTHTGLSVADLGRAIRGIRSKRVVLLLNACFAGEVAPAFIKAGGIAHERLGAALPDAQSNRLLDEATEPNGAGRAIITASRPDQLSLFSNASGRSFFTQALLEALRGGDGSWAQSKVIGLFELYTYLHTKVPLLVQNARGEAQEPTLTLLLGVGNFPVAAAQGGAGARSEQLMQTLPDSTAIRMVGRDQISAQTGSTVNIDNRQEAPLISFGANSSIGDVQIGDVARGDIIKTYVPGSAPTDAKNEAIDPAKLLPRLSREIGQARNVDENTLDDAVAKIDAAVKALSRKNTARTLECINEALAILAPLRANDYVNSRARKLEQVRDAISRED
jgi:hypothetical protein